MVGVLVALDGINFEKVVRLRWWHHRLLLRWSGASEDGASIVPGCEACLVGSHFGDAGSIVRVAITHVVSGTDYACDGTVQDGAPGDFDQPQSVVFVVPDDMDVAPDQDELAYRCTAEVSVDGGASLTDWRTILPWYRRHR